MGEFLAHLERLWFHVASDNERDEVVQAMGQLSDEEWHRVNSAELGFREWSELDIYERAAVFSLLNQIADSEATSERAEGREDRDPEWLSRVPPHLQPSVRANWNDLTKKEQKAADRGYGAFAEEDWAAIDAAGGGKPWDELSQADMARVAAAITDVIDRKSR